MKVVTADDAPEGKRYVTFTNIEPGRGCRALQGFAIDGRKVHEIKLSCMARGKDIQRSAQAGHRGGSDDRVLRRKSRDRGDDVFDPDAMRGTFDWQREEPDVLEVPASAREAIITLA